MTKLTTILAGLAAVVMSFSVSCKKDRAKENAQQRTQKPALKNAETKVPPTPATLDSDAALRAAQACVEASNAHDLDKLLACYAKDIRMVMLDWVGPKMPTHGHDALKANMTAYWAGFPDAHETPQILIANGNQVAMLTLETGTNSGETMGMKPTGQKVSLFGADLMTLNLDGTVAKRIHLGDQSTFAHQLGRYKSERSPSSENPFDSVVIAAAKTGDLAVARNVSIVESFIEAMDTGNIAAVKAHSAQTISFRYIPQNQPIAGVDEYMKSLAMWKSMYKSRNRTIREIFGAGDWVVVHSSYTGIIGMDIPGAKVKTTGKPVKMNTIEFFEVADTLIKAHWVVENAYAWAVQAGIVDPPTAVKDTRDLAPAKGAIKKANEALKNAEKAAASAGKTTNRAIHEAEKATNRVSKDAKRATKVLRNVTPE